MLLIAVVLGIILLLAGIGRTLYKGQFNSLQQVLLTMFFLDIVFDDWSSDDSDITDSDF